MCLPQSSYLYQSEEHCPLPGQLLWTFWTSLYGQILIFISYKHLTVELLGHNVGINLEEAARTFKWLHHFYATKNIYEISSDPLSIHGQGNS